MSALIVPPLPPRHAPDEFFDVLTVTGMPRAPIGKGTSRWVYDLPGHPDKVLKVCVVPSNVANWIEALVFDWATDKSILGEVFSYSRSGQFLIMERLVDIAPTEANMFRPPDWWNDRKPSSLGKAVDGTIKIRDYAMVKILLDPPIF